MRKSAPVLFSWGSLLFGAVLCLVGCAHYAPTPEKILCTRPLIADKKIVVSVAPITSRLDGPPDERFIGAVEAGVQTEIRRQGGHPMEQPPYDALIHSRVEITGDRYEGTAEVFLKVVSAAEGEVIANGSAGAAYGAGKNRFASDMQAVQNAAGLAAENLCAVRVQASIPLPRRTPTVSAPRSPSAPAPSPPAPSYGNGEMEIAVSPYYYHYYPYAGPAYEIYGSGPARGSVTIPLPRPLLPHEVILKLLNRGHSRSSGSGRRATQSGGSRSRR